MTTEYGTSGPQMYTTRLTLRADEIGDGWQLLDAADEETWHPVRVADCLVEHYLADDDGQGGQLDPAYDNCVVLVSAAYGAMECHISGDEPVQVRIPAAPAVSA